jgi:vacuolar-type H+-ATPase subunit I/STV1
MVIVKNTTKRPESLPISGRQLVKFSPGDNEIADAEYLALTKPRRNKPSRFSWFVDEGILIVKGDVPESVPEPEVVEDKAVAKAKEKLAEAQETAAKKKQAEAEAAEKKKRVAETKTVREEINSLLRKNQKRSMKYDDLAEDYKVERKDIKELVKVSNLDASNLFLKWLQSETR